MQSINFLLNIERGLANIFFLMSLLSSFHSLNIRTNLWNLNFFTPFFITWLWWNLTFTSYTLKDSFHIFVILKMICYCALMYHFINLKFFYYILYIQYDNFFEWKSIFYFSTVHKYSAVRIRLIYFSSYRICSISFLGATINHGFHGNDLRTK